IWFGVGRSGTAGYLISRAAEHPAVLSLTAAIVGVRFFGLARPLARYFERLASHGVAPCWPRPARRPVLQGGRTTRPGKAGGHPARGPAVAVRGGRRLAPEPLPTGPRAAADRADRRRRFGPPRRLVPSRNGGGGPGR